VRAITAEGLARLLRRLGDDPDRAGVAYERLRRTLIKFFDWRGAWAPDECADETLDRLAEKLAVDTQIDDIARYAHGVARLVLLERLRRQAQDPLGAAVEEADFSAFPSIPPGHADEALHQCFEQCLAGLAADSRTLVLEYYVGVGRTKIEHRRTLARSLGLSDNALRSRVQRLRDRVEQCVESCVATADAHGLEAALRHVSTDRDTLQVKASDGN
jgi:DNA-directed RNA polymerase specialized sigma24 family protein